MSENVKIINRYQDDINDNICALFKDNKELYLGEFEMKRFTIIKQFYFIFIPFHQIYIISKWVCPTLFYQIRSINLSQGDNMHSSWIQWNFF